MERTALIINPNASGVCSDLVHSVTRALGAVSELEVYTTRERGHAVNLVKELPLDISRLFALGGDGLFNEVANGITSKVSVGLLPAGASNVLPRALGIPSNPLEAVSRLAKSTTVRQISLGVANGRRFTFACGLGIDAEIVRAVDLRGRSHGSRPSDFVFMWELLKLLAGRYFVISPSMEVVGHGRCAFVLACNGDPYTYAWRFPVHATPLASFQEGIDIVAPRKLSPVGLIGALWAAFARPGLQMRSRHVLYLHDVDGITIRCDYPMPLQVDGEDIGDVTSLDLSVKRQGMAVLT